MQPEHLTLRQPVYARRGMVATSQPLAAQAGLAVLREGGNAVDAAIAAAAALTVVEPTSNGIGGDLFALVWKDGQLHGLNASGGAPARLTHDALGGQPMPVQGWLPVTVPGAVKGWADLHTRFGRLDFGRVLHGAITYARDGYPLSPVLAHNWARAARIYRARKQEFLQHWFETFMPGSFTPAPGALWASEGHARTLELLADTHGAAFYTGAIAEQIHAHAQSTGGLLSAEDLAAHTSEWVNPIHARYGEHDLWEIPPNGQGIAALIALGIMNGVDLPDHAQDPAGLHLQIEAMKLGFADAHAHVADPRHADVPVERLLSAQHHATQRARITDTALDPSTPAPSTGGTVYLATADEDGTMVSLIQSNYMGFGSGIVVPGTGIALHNRGHNFHADPNHPNGIRPGKRPYHTIIPGFMTRADGTPVGPLGVMGGFMQPQGHLQVTLNMLRYGMSPQAALDAPRWQWTNGRTVEVEHELPAHVARALAARGHDVRVNLDPNAFGRGQIIVRDACTGVYCGGSEPRTDGLVAAY